MDSGDTIPRLGDRVPDMTTRRCVARGPNGVECGAPALQHVLYRDGEQAWTTTVCHLHVADSRRVAGYVDHHVWTTWRSACNKPYATWVAGSEPGLGHCEELRDEQDAELAELLQHARLAGEMDP